MLFFGIVTLILGVLVTLKPKDTIYAFAILLGIWLFVAGLFRIVMAIADHEDTGGTRWLMAVLGLLSVIIGILFLRHTDETVTTLAFLIGLFWVVGGIIEFFTAYSDHGSEARGWRIAMGVLAFAAGIVTLVVAPPHPGRPGRHHGDLADHLRRAGDRPLPPAAPPGRRLPESARAPQACRRPAEGRPSGLPAALARAQPAPRR